MNALAKNGYDVDFVNKQIKITKEFNEASGDITTEAFKTMMALREQLPDFEFVETKVRKYSDGKKNGRVQGLNMEFMRVFIEDLHGEDSSQIKEFEKVLELSKCRKSARYAYMKQWFNATYPEAITILGGLPDEERRKQREEERHNEAKKALAAAKKTKEAKELQATRAMPNDNTNKTVADHEESATRETESELNRRNQ